MISPIYAHELKTPIFTYELLPPTEKPGSVRSPEPGVYLGRLLKKVCPVILILSLGLMTFSLQARDNKQKIKSYADQFPKDKGWTVGDHAELIRALGDVGLE